MTTEELEQIAKLLEPLKQGQERLEQGQTRLEKGQATHHTALKALGAGHQDLTEQVKTIQKTQKTLATKQDVDAAAEAAKSDILAAVHTLTARLVRQVQSHERRLDNAGIPNPDKH